MRRWWERKFSLPWSDERAQSLTLFELTKLYWEDIYASDSKALMEASRNENGDVVFEETGDPLIDKWEKEIAMGAKPDLTEGLTQEELDRMRADQANAERAKAGMDALFADEDGASPGSRAWKMAAANIPTGLGGGDMPTLDPGSMLR